MSDPKNLPSIQTGQPATTALSAFSNIGAFESAQRMAQALAASDLVPSSFKGNVANCLVGLEVAQRVGASPLMVFQNLNVIHGRPSWSSTFIIAALNSCGRFAPIRFKMEKFGKRKFDYEYWTGEKPNRVKKQASIEIEDASCIAWTVDKSGEVLEGPTVTMGMAVQEGWYTKSDSKWKTMPELMLRYRAAAFFGRLYAPDVLMGLRTQEEESEIIDVTPNEMTQEAPAAPESSVKSINEKIAGRRKAAKQAEQQEVKQEEATGVTEINEQDQQHF